MHHNRFARLLAAGIVALALVATGCTDPFEASKSDGLNDGGSGDGGLYCTDVTGDEDGDGISNGDEGCLTGRDTDTDKIPDWQDFDSDDDGIPDAIERGDKDADGNCAAQKAPKNSWPCDNDGDGVPDYMDVDSDNDGLLDKDEDFNGDGILGCCLVDCNKPLGQQSKDCLLTQDGCGTGQTCEAGKCTPAIDFHCSNGETDPTKKDTFGDGKLDNERGTFICRDATEDNPKGRKPVQLRKNTTGDWHVALETTSTYGELNITGAGPKDAAGVVDDDATSTEVAGFVISRDTVKDSVQDELTEILQAITNKPPGGSGTISQRGSGSQVKSHDKYDAVEGTILDLSLSTASNVSTVRNELIGLLSGKPMASLGNLPSPYGSSHSEFVIRFVTLKRFEFKKDAQGNLVKDANGYPVDSGDKTKWRLLVMGAVAGRDNYQDPTRTTGLIVDDLSNGTALATAADWVNNECDVANITSLPIADIIWVVDESGSMDDKRDDVKNNASEFFTRALSSGLDFRMGVTGVCNPNSSYGACADPNIVGKFCSKDSSAQDDGGVDRFILPSEQTIFNSCIYNPPGDEGGSEYGLINMKEAIVRHLPRAAGDPAKIRPNAKLVIIIATDEIPNSLNSVLSGKLGTCNLDATTQNNLNQALQPYVDLLTGATDPEAQGVVHLIGGLCNSTGCSWSPDVCHGYIELVQQLGGLTGDVCQKNLGPTLQIIIDSIIAETSPVELDYVPISASLAVALDGKEIERSRSNGFDYQGSGGSPRLVFINVKYQKGSQVIASYKRWEKQAVPE
jgi:hypothetical protein